MRNGKLIDLALLIVAAFLINLFHFSLLATLLSTFLAISLVSLCLFERYPKFQAAVCLALAIAALLWQPMLTFLSLALYFAIQHTWRSWLVLSLIPSASLLLSFSVPMLSSAALLQLPLAAWLSDKTQRNMNLYQELLAAKDKFRELQLHYQSEQEQWEVLRLSEAKTATLEERARIAREMHDSLGHVLSRAILQTAALAKLNKDRALTEPLQALEESLNSGMTQTRASLHQLRDQAQDLYREMTLLCQSYPNAPFTIKLDYELAQLPPVKYQQIFLANTREALTNVQKHSAATKVEVRLREYPGFYQLVIQDNGVASSSEFIEDTYYKEGMGLENMRLRCEALAGNFVIRQGKGFGLFMTLPKSNKFGVVRQAKSEGRQDG